LDELNKTVPGIGRDVQYFIADQQIESALLQPGQPYSVFPKSFKRTDESRATVSDTIEPMRLEGPMTNIQWAVLDTDRNPIGLPSNDKVPAEIKLLQLWKVVIWKKLKHPAVQILWGNHYRAGTIIETGKVTSLEEADMVEVLAECGNAPTQTHVDVNYTVGSETFKTRVKNGTTIAEFREALSYSHKGK
jgi:hypothetical protein